MNLTVQDHEAPSSEPNNIELDALYAEHAISKSKMAMVIGLIGLISFGVWGYAYSGYAGRRTPDLLESADFAAFAGPRCTATVAELALLPQPLEAVDNVERAAQIRVTNAVYTNMLDDLAAGATGSDSDVGLINEWITDWRTYVDHRADYADRFELDGTERFYVSSVGRERLEKRIPRFANTNEIYDCITPTDIG